MVSLSFCAFCVCVCVYIAPCNSGEADCVENTTCVNSPDGFACLCDFGLTGDGRMGGSGCVGKKN